MSMLSFVFLKQLGLISQFLPLLCQQKLHYMPLPPWYLLAIELAFPVTAKVLSAAGGAGASGIKLNVLCIAIQRSLTVATSLH